METFRKTSPETPYVVKIGYKYLAIFIKAWMFFMRMTAKYETQQYVNDAALIPWQRFQYLLYCWSRRMKISRTRKRQYFCFHDQKLLNELVTKLLYIYSAYVAYLLLVSARFTSLRLFHGFLLQSLFIRSEKPTRWTFILCSFLRTGIFKRFCQRFTQWNWKILFRLRFFSYCSTIAEIGKTVVMGYYIILSIVLCGSKYVAMAKLKSTLVQALRLCAGRTAHKRSRGIDLLFLDHGARRGWEVSVTTRPLVTPRNEPVPIVQEAGWDPGPVWTGVETLTPSHRNSIPGQSSP